MHDASMTSEAVPYATPSPEALAAAARMMGGTNLVRGTDVDPEDSLWHLHNAKGQCVRCIGSDADLCFALLATMPYPRLYRDEEGWRCDSNWCDDYPSYGRGSTPLDAVLACIKAMEEGQ